MFNKRRGFFSTIFYCLKGGKFKGALLQFFVTLIILSNYYFKKCKYLLLKFHYGKIRREIIVEINKRYKMYLNFEDKGICEDLIINKTREVFTTAHIQKIITEDMIIIDIGANIGYYALLESQLASKGHIYAVEPVLKNYYLLRKNLTLNNCNNVSTYNFAIGNVDSHLEMYIYDKCNWSSFIKNPGGNIIDTVQVPVFTLDKFIDSYLTHNPHFIRMDVEGFEYEILMGAKKTLQTVTPLMICIEIHPHLISKEKVSSIITMMKDNGFAINSIFNDVNGSELKFLSVFNQLQTILHLPPYGYLGNNYSLLEEILEYGGVMVFFQKI